MKNLSPAIFQSTHPVWGATKSCERGTCNAVDFNPRTPCGVRRYEPGHLFQRPPISIHAPRVGCDALTLDGRPYRVVISIHAPRVGCDAVPMWNPTAIWPFQSTHPVWGATRDGQLIPKVVIHFNPRTPCGVRRVSTSIRFPSWSYFNPRTPCGVRHAWPATGQTRYSISIHAPRVGCDDGWAMCPQCGKDFNPRTPCGVRHRRTGLGRGDCHFNPRTPCGVRLYSGWIIKRGFKISIHAPRVGCDWKMWKVIKRQCYFNPRTPCGVRPQASLTASIFSNFNPRTPCGVRHSAPSGPLYRRCISIHAPRVGCDKLAPHNKGGPYDFNPRTPCGVRRR